MNTLTKTAKPIIPAIVILGSEFFNHLGIGLKGTFTPFKKQIWPEISLSHRPDGQIEVTTKKDGTVTMRYDDAIYLNKFGKLNLIYGPSRFTAGSWAAARAATPLSNESLRLNDNSDVFVPRDGHYAIAFEASYPHGEQVATFDKPTSVVKGCDAVILFDRHGVAKRAWIRDENCRASQDFLIEYGKRKPSGALEAYVQAGREAFEAEAKAQRLAVEKNNAMHALINKLDVREPVLVNVEGKTFTVSYRKINRGNRVGGNKADFATLFDNGLLQKIVTQVTGQNAAAATA